MKGVLGNLDVRYVINGGHMASAHRQEFYLNIKAFLRIHRQSEPSPTTAASLPSSIDSFQNVISCSLGFG